MDDGVLVWLRSVGSVEPDVQILKGHAQNFVSDIRIFDDIDECIQTILSISEEKVFLRLGRNLSYLVNVINDFNQVQYVYLSEPSEYKGCIKVRGVFRDNIELFDQLRKDMNAWKNHHVYLTFCDADIQRMETSTQGIKQHAARFMWSQMLLENLLHIPVPVSNPYKDVLDESRRLYKNDSVELKRIDEFEREYQAKDAIKWYTRNIFLYRVVNKALRTQDICLIFKFRFIIQHIHNQLRNEQQKTFGTLRFPITLYRGQFMTKDEFEQLQMNTGQLISVNTFLSTTTAREVAELFSDPSSIYTGLLSVLFEIVIDSNCDVLSLPPFADISNLSYMRDENEVLLSMGTIMQVESIIRINPTAGKIHLRMCRHDNPMVDQMKAYLSREIHNLQSNESSYIHQLGSMLYYMGEHKKARQLFNMVATGENAWDDIMRPLFVFSARLAEQFFVSNDSTSLLRNEIPKFISLIKELGNNPMIPDVLQLLIQDIVDYCMIPGEKCALNEKMADEEGQLFEKFAEFLHSLGSFLFPETHPTMVNSYLFLGGVAAYQGKHAKAIGYFEKALAAAECSFDKTHPTYTFILGHMAQSFMEMNDDARAEKMIQQINSHHSSAHLSSLFSLRLSANLFQKREDWHAVIACHKDILELTQSSPNSLDTVQSYIMIAGAFVQLQDLEAARNNFQIALNLMLQHHPLDHPFIKMIQDTIPMLEVKRISQQMKDFYEP